MAEYQLQAQEMELSVYINNGKLYIQGVTLTTFGKRNMVYQEIVNFYEISKDELDVLLNTYSPAIEISPIYYTMNSSQMDLIANPIWKDKGSNTEEEIYTDLDTYQEAILKWQTFDSSLPPEFRSPKPVYRPDLNPANEEYNPNKPLDDYTYQELITLKRNMNAMLEKTTPSIKF